MPRKGSAKPGGSGGPHTPRITTVAKKDAEIRFVRYEQTISIAGEDTVLVAGEGQSGRVAPPPHIPEGWTVDEVLAAHVLCLQQVLDVLGQRVAVAIRQRLADEALSRVEIERARAGLGYDQ